MQICRICLESNTKFYEMEKFNLYEMYEQVTGVTATREHHLPNTLCWECTHRLTSCYRFKSKALTSHTLMMDKITSHHFLTSLKSVDRAANNLVSTLSYKRFDVDHNDLHVHDANVTPSDLKWTGDDKIEIFDLEVKENDEFDGTDYIDDIDENTFVDYIHKKSTINTNITPPKTKKYKKKLTQIDKSLPKLDRRKKPIKDVFHGDIFLITDLTFDEQVLEIARRKEGANYKKSDYRCEECYKGFLDEEAYRCHMVRHTDQCGPYTCEICKVRFKKQHALRNHVASHLQKFTCKRCPYVTTRRHAAKLHEEYHNGTRYQCPHCEEDFGKFSTYMSHVRIKHPSDYICELCGYSFVSEKGLAMHKKLKHRFDEHLVSADGPHCEQCDVRFISEAAHRRHLQISTRHSGQPESKENGRTEDSTEKRDTAQKRRNKNSKPEGPISCEQCDMQLPDSISYYRHFRRTHPDKNRTNYPSMKTKSMCEVCGKMFQSLALLQDHSFTHSDSKQFKCGQCGKSFQRKYRLIAHSRVHAAQRATHECAVCGKRFTTTSNMQRHMVSHTGLKPFKCEMCGKCFKHASEKRVHITYVHLKKPWPKRSRGKRKADSRQSQQSAPALELVQPLWPACTDPKLTDIAMEKAVYYNLKM